VRADLLPDRAGIVELDRIQPLDLDDPETLQAFDPQDPAPDVAQSQILPADLKSLS
jgi:hypothetical protein